MSYTATGRTVTQERFEAPEKDVGDALLDPEDRKTGSVEEILVNAFDEP